MVPSLHSLNSSAFMALPLELRQQVYRLCVPENFQFRVLGSTMYKPPAHFEKGLNRYDIVEGDPLLEENGHRLYDWESSEVSSIHEEDGDKQEEYKPSRLDDYSQLYKPYPPQYSPSHRIALPALLLVCRQITGEVKEILYGKNTFEFNIHSLDQSQLRRWLSFDTRKQIRKMVLVFRPMGIGYRPDFRMDQKIWDSFLGSLSILGVIAEQPLRPSPYASPIVKPEDVFQEWSTWLKPILEYLNKALPKTAEVVVDVNKEEETTHIFNKVMPGRCRFQRLRTADSMYKRGDFSVESGYSDDDGIDDDPIRASDCIDECDHDYYYD